jgi:hypothetical protein
LIVRAGKGGSSKGGSSKGSKGGSSHEPEPEGDGCCEYKEMCPESEGSSGGKYRQLAECESVCVKYGC